MGGSETSIKPKTMNIVISIASIVLAMILIEWIRRVVDERKTNRALKDVSVKLDQFTQMQIVRMNSMKQALEKIIEMNRQNAEDQYGDAEKAESWSCVTVAREGLAGTFNK